MQTSTNIFLIEKALTVYTRRGQQIYFTDATNGASFVKKNPQMIPLIVMSLILYGLIPIKMRQQWQLKRLTAASLTDFSGA